MFGRVSDGRSSTFSKMSSVVVSRMTEDFDEIETLGKGYFGRVVRCRNKLDKMDYAIKITKKKIKN